MEQAVRGGLRFVLVRERDLDDATFAHLAERVRAVLPEDAVLSVHGRPALARALSAGFHLA